jgi:hypothetical protein
MFGRLRRKQGDSEPVAVAVAAVCSAHACATRKGGRWPEPAGCFDTSAPSA